MAVFTLVCYHRSHLVPKVTDLSIDSRAAHQRLATMNVGIIRGGGEVEILNDQGRLEVSRDQMNSH